MCNDGVGETQVQTTHYYFCQSFSIFLEQTKRILKISNVSYLVHLILKLLFSVLQGHYSQGDMG